METTLENANLNIQVERNWNSEKRLLRGWLIFVIAKVLENTYSI